MTAPWHVGLISEFLIKFEEVLFPDCQILLFCHICCHLLQTQIASINTSAYLNNNIKSSVSTWETAQPNTGHKRRGWVVGKSGFFPWTYHVILCSFLLKRSTEQCGCVFNIILTLLFICSNPSHCLYSLFLLIWANQVRNCVWSNLRFMLLSPVTALTPSVRLNPLIS